MSRNKKILIAVGILVVVGAIVFANLKFKQQTGTVVNVEAVQKRDLLAIVSASGKIQPHNSVNISADTMGRVTNLAVDEGYRVTRGQFLMQIDPKLLAMSVNQGEASLAAARSTAEQLRVQIDSAKASLKTAQDAYTRQQQLWKGGLTTKESLDNAENQLKMQQAALDSANKQVETQQLRMKQEQASLESAKYNLSKVRIESPIDGIVTKRNIEEGETVVVGTMNNAGTVLLTIADMSDIEAQVEVDETDIPNVKIGQPAKVTVDAMTGKTFAGHVVEIGNSPITTTGTSASQATNFLVKVKVDDAMPEVRPGFTCTAEITTATRPQVLGIPIQATTVREMVVDKASGAIVRDDAKGVKGRPGASTVQAQDLKPGQERKELEGVFLVKDNKAVFTPVKTGIAGDKYFEALTGVNAGDQVIVGPFSSVRELKDGGPVKVEAAVRGATTDKK